MFTAVKGVWALFLGIGLIMLGNGLQATLLSLRASIEDFSTASIGAIMTGYYVGFLAGSLLAPKVVGNVGHVRVFAALASLASTAVLVHILFVEPYTWFAMRLVTGFSYAGLYVVAESWLNDRATNKTRGQLLSAYMVVIFSGLAAGQLLLNVSDPAGFKLFVVASVLVSLALIPMLVTAAPAPQFTAPSAMGLKSLYDVSPLGVVGCAATGVAHGAIFSMGAVYGQKMGFSVGTISLFMGSIVVGGIVLQWPIGSLSDKFDRRKVLTGVALLAALIAVSCVAISRFSETGLLIAVAVLGGLSLPMYSVCIAHTNDHLQPEQMVAASAALVLIGGLGSCFGPFSAAGLMSVVGPDGFFWALAGAHALIGLFALYRMTRRGAVPLDEQGHYVTVPSSATQMAAPLSEVHRLRDVQDRELARLSVGRS